VVVGVNKFISAGDEPYQPLRVDPSIERDQAERLARLRAARDAGQWQRRIDDLRRPRPARRTCSFPSARRCAPGRPWERPATPCARCGGVYQPAEIT
jgi:methylmalonyl-CoA mutase N-terminal domain/subunit